MQKGSPEHFNHQIQINQLSILLPFHHGRHETGDGGYRKEAAGHEERRVVGVGGVIDRPGQRGAHDSRRPPE